MYRHRLSSFWYVVVTILVLSIDMFRSRKVDLGITHFSLPQLLSVFVKAAHVLSLLCVGGSHMPKMSSMYCL
jgi:hypothetical protein